MESAVTTRSRKPVLIAGSLVALVGLAAAVFVLRSDGPGSVTEQDPRGSPAWAARYYGNPDARGFKKRKVVAIDFLGRTLFVHRGASPHFLRLERLFEARAPEYAALVAAGDLDDWSYDNRAVSGTSVKSNHAFGIAIDLNALTNPLGSAGDMPTEVIAQWEREGGDWGGDWARPDPMHFETHLTPAEIRRRYHRDGTPRDWYLEELVGE